MDKTSWKKVLLAAGLKPERDFRQIQFAGASALEEFYAEAAGQKFASLLLEAPTGSGKTLMALGPLMLLPKRSRPTIYSVPGKLLQKQIYDTAVKLQIKNPVLLQGRANYICSETCYHWLKTIPPKHAFAAELRELCDFIKSGDVYDINEMIPWIRTFIGRITNLQMEDKNLEKRFKEDINAMYNLYRVGGDGNDF